MLIAHDGRPVLSDFRESRLLVDSKTVIGTTALKGVMRWMAPELIEPDEEDEMEDRTRHACHTKATDVWAFGMVIYVSAIDSAEACSRLTRWSGGTVRKHSILHSPKQRLGDNIDIAGKATWQT